MMALHITTIVAILFAQARHPVQENPCRADVHRYANGGIKSCILARDHTLAGSLLPAGSDVSFDETGALRMSRLARASEFYGRPLPAQSTVFFDRQGRMDGFWLHTDAAIDGHLLGAREDGARDSLYPNGRLRAGFIAGDEEIDGVPCTSSANPFKMGPRVISLGTQRMVRFYDNGRLQQAMVSRDVTIQGHAFKKGDLVYLTPDGELDLGAKKLR